MENDTNTDRKEEANEMIFPINVSQSLKSAAGLSSDEKTALIVGTWLFVCGIICWLTFAFLTRALPKYAVILTVLVLIVLNLTIGVYVLRFALDERSVLNEYTNTNGDSFSNYFQIYRDTTASGKHNHGIIEYNDGTYAAVIQLRFGYNTDERSKAAWETNRNVFKFLNQSKYSYKILTLTEHFRESDSAEFMRNHLSKITDPVLKEVQKNILRNLFDIADNESNVPVMYLVIFATTQIQRDDMEDIIDRVYRFYTNGQTCYRDIKILSGDEINNLLRDYYELEIMDMSILRTAAVKNDVELYKTFELLKLYGVSGKTYSTKEAEKIYTDIIKQTGLKKVTK